MSFANRLFCYYCIYLLYGKTFSLSKKCSSVFEWILSDPSIDLSFLSLFGFQGAFQPLSRLWWAQMDSNHRPRAYQARALTN